MENHKTYFSKIDFTKFWAKDQYSIDNEVVTNEKILEVEKKTGFKLPPSLIEILKIKNGGTPNCLAFPTKTQTTWSHNHIQITNFCSLKEIANIQLRDEWQYLSTGLVICDCPSGGHDVVMMDYSECGPNGDPKIIHYDQEMEQTTFLCNNFIEFVEGLLPTSYFDDELEEDDLTD